MALDGILRSVYPDLIRDACWSGLTVDQSFRVVVIGVVEHLFSGGLNLLCHDVMSGLEYEVSHATLPVLSVAPGKLRLEKGANRGSAPGMVVRI